jgi:hypothetical protein
MPPPALWADMKELIAPETPSAGGPVAIRPQPQRAIVNRARAPGGVP